MFFFFFFAYHRSIPEPKSKVLKISADGNIGLAEDLEVKVERVIPQQEEVDEEVDADNVEGYAETEAEVLGIDNENDNEDVEAGEDRGDLGEE